MSQAKQIKEDWTDKYRPETLDEIVGQEHVIERLQYYVSKGELPHLMFSGPPGVGKTTAALCIANELYGENADVHFLELNASDSRGIDVVRERIKNFCKGSLQGLQHRIIFLDEADALTQDAQAALRRVMEKYTKDARFILSCNYPAQIIPAIQSRCSLFRFGGVSDEEAKEYAERIVTEENIDISDEAVDIVAKAADGDMRRVAHYLQSVSTLEKSVEASDVKELIGYLDEDKVREILNIIHKGDFKKALVKTEELVYEDGISVRELVDGIYDIVKETELEDEQLVNILQEIGEIDYRLVKGGTEDVQIAALLATISKEITHD